MNKLDIINLPEYERKYLPLERLTQELGQLLWSEYKEQIDIETPSFKTQNRWSLRSKGWVGRIPLTPEQEIILSPKVPIENIFGMLEYAYNLKKFKLLDGSTKYGSIEDFYEILAIILSKNILERGRKGFYREYKPHNERLCYVRGRINIMRMVLKPWDVRLECNYKDSTPDIIENQILAWTIYRILHSGLCTNRSLPHLYRAYRALQGSVSIKPFNASDCVARLYNRLNQDYHLSHSLCRFFLDNSGPSHRIGDHIMQPFLVGMENLYELFVAEWLEAHKSLLPKGYLVKAHDKVSLGQKRKVTLDIDLVLYRDGKAICVLDTKYKNPDKIKNQNPDIFQISYYARSKDCRQAALIYPKIPEEPFDEPLKDIRVRYLGFSLEGDLDKAGKLFIDQLLETIDI